MNTKVVLAALLIISSMAGCLDRVTEWPEPYRDDCDRNWFETNNSTNNTTLEEERLWYAENCAPVDPPRDNNTATNSTEREE